MTLFSSKRMVFETNSPDETKRIGMELGSRLAAGDLICLYGELGSGKTCLVQGIAAGLGVTDRWVTSPTFTLMNIYSGRCPLYHCDLYRLGPIPTLRDLGMEELMSGDGVCIVEWADRLKESPSEERIDVRMAWRGENEREMTVTAFGSRLAAIVEGI